jgi:hypothetical protein
MESEMRCSKCGLRMTRLFEDFYFCNGCGQSKKHGQETNCNGTRTTEVTSKTEEKAIRD